jgi:hypothetical protein
MSYRNLTVLLAMVLLITACREDDGLVGGTGGSRAFVVSDPQGARILVDERETSRLTPDTIRGLSGQRTITTRFDTADATYGYSARVIFSGNDTTVDIAGPLLFRCQETLCYQNAFVHHAANRVRFANNPVGVQFLEDGTGGQGLLWPSVSNNGYVSGAMPIFAGMMLGDTVSLGAYDTGYLAGRPAPTVTQSADSVAVRQTTWVLPPPELLQFVTARGVAIDQHIVSTQRTDDVVAIRLVFRNITAEPLYQLVDPAMPQPGATITNAFVGFLLDPDIGNAADDAISYAPELDMAFAYDAHFSESDYGSGFNLKPALVGLRVLERPEGTNVGVALNGWARSKDYSADWRAGTITEGAGWLMLSGTRSYQPDDPSRWIGHLPPETGDMRLTVTAGPVTLAPGDSAAITVAIVLAEPAPETFTSGNLQDPGNPTDPSRQLLRIAAGLLERARAADALLASFGR